jgi:hypothetical protein
VSNKSKAMNIMKSDIPPPNTRDYTSLQSFMKFIMLAYKKHQIIYMFRGLNIKNIEPSIANAKYVLQISKGIDNELVAQIWKINDNSGADLIYEQHRNDAYLLIQRYIYNNPNDQIDVNLNKIGSYFILYTTDLDIQGRMQVSFNNFKKLITMSQNKKIKKQQICCV